MELQTLLNNESAYSHRQKINENFDTIIDSTDELFERVATVEADGATKVTSPTNNNILAMDSAGNLKDSGLSVDSLATVGNMSAHNTSASAHSALFSKKAAKSISLTGTLLASGWTATAPYSQILNITGITANSNGFIGVADSATRTQYEVAAMANLRKIAQNTNTVTIMAYGEKPNIDIPIEIVITD